MEDVKACTCINAMAYHAYLLGPLDKFDHWWLFGSSD